MQGRVDLYAQMPEIVAPDSGDLAVQSLLFALEISSRWIKTSISLLVLIHGSG